MNMYIFNLSGCVQYVEKTIIFVFENNEHKPQTKVTVESVSFCFADSVDVIKAARGSSVHLPCEPTSQEHDVVLVKWKKSGLVNPICEYSLNLTYVNPKHCLPSFKPSLHGLNVAHFKNSHSGSYSCLTTRIIPPPTEDIYNTTMELHSMEGNYHYVFKM